MLEGLLCNGDAFFHTSHGTHGLPEMKQLREGARFGRDAFKNAQIALVIDAAIWQRGMLPAWQLDHHDLRCLIGVDLHKVFMDGPDPVELTLFHNAFTNDAELILWHFVGEGDNVGPLLFNARAEVLPLLGGAAEDVIGVGPCDVISRSKRPGVIAGGCKIIDVRPVGVIGIVEELGDDTSAITGDI